MRVIYIPLLFLGLVACTQSQPETTPMAVAISPGMLDVKLGSPFERDLVGPSTPIGGLSIFDAAMPSGPLFDTFYDYSVQVDAESKRAIAVSARRTFSDFAECGKHLAQVVPLVRAKYRFETPDEGPYRFSGVSGPVKVNLDCSTRDHVTAQLSLHVFHVALSRAVQERMAARHGSN